VHLLLAVLECLIESGGASSALGAINRGLLSKAANTIPKWPRGRECSREQGCYADAATGKTSNLHYEFDFLFIFAQKIAQGGGLGGLGGLFVM